MSVLPVRLCLIQSQTEMEMDLQEGAGKYWAYYKSISHLLHSHGLTYPKPLLASLDDAAVFVSVHLSSTLELHHGTGT
jgi:hypothetical protein